MKSLATKFRFDYLTKVALFAVVAVVLSAAAAGQTSRSAGDKSAPNTVQSGFQSTGEMPREVDMSALPQMTEKELSELPEAYAPLDGRTDAERAARKQLARERAAAGLEGGRALFLAFRTPGRKTCQLTRLDSR